MKITNDKNHYQKRVLIIMLLIIILLCFSFWYLHSQYVYQAYDYKKVSSENSVWDLSGHNFDDSFVRIVGEVEYIPDAVLTPQEFEARSDDVQMGYPEDNRTSSARLTILMPDDTTYMFVDHSVDFSEIIYINGELRQTVGVPGLSEEDSAPDYAYLNFEVKPINGVIEIIRNTSNFVHHESGNPDGFSIGKPEIMKRLVAIQTDLSAFTMGMFFLMFLVHVLLFMIFHTYRANLYFSLLCLTWCLRTGVVATKVIGSWFPNLSWYVMFRLEYLTAPIAAVLVLLIVGEMFPKLLPKWFIKVFVALFAAYGVFCLISPTLLLSYTMFGFIAAFSLVALVTVIMLFMKLPAMVRKKEMQVEHWVLLAGIIVFIIAAIRDGLYYKVTRIFNIPYAVSDLALMILIFFQMIAMFYATMRQVTEAIEAKQEIRLEAEALYRASKMKEEFLGNLSHELQAPLTVISGFAQITDKMLNSENLDIDNLHGNLRRVMEESDRMGNLVIQLLDITAIDSGTFKMHFEETDIEYLIRQIETSHFPILNAGRNRLIVNITSGLPMILADRERLLQVLVNLISNAVNHTKNGTITIEASIDNDRLKVKVEDTGIGISKELLLNLFSRFPDNRDNKGTGLGLYICQQIINAHGGIIDVQSEVGAGTTVYFEIPVKYEGEQ